MKTTKKLLAILLVLATLFSVSITSALNVSAAGSSMNNATSISFGTTYNDSITESNAKDFYKFTMNTSGKINLKATSYMYRITYRIYDSNGNEVWSKLYYWNSTLEQCDVNETLDLTSGTYYFTAEKYYETGKYSFKISFKSANESFKETIGGTNNTIAKASLISSGNTYYGQIALNDNKDIYVFNLSSSGRINLKSTAYIYRATYRLYDSNGKELWSQLYYWNSTLEQSDINEKFDLTTGKYYLAVEKYYETGNYTFNLSYTSANENFAETNGGINNTFTSASSISVKNTYYGQIALNDNKDIYKFNVSSGKIVVKATAYIYRSTYRLYDSNGKELWSQIYYWDNTLQKSNIEKEIEIKSAGTYYFAVEKYSETGNYNFSITDDSIDTTYKVTYNANGGSVSPSSKTVNAGEYVTLPTPTKKATITYNANGGSNAPSAKTVSITCDGWSTSSTATSGTYDCGASYKPSKSITLYAVWAKTSTTLSSNEPTRSGHEFLGWSTSSTATSPDVKAGGKVTLSKDVTLYAVWKKAETTSTPTFTLSSTSVSVGKNTSKNVTLSVTWNGFGGKIKSRYEIDDKTICSCEWLGWDSNKNTLKITGLKPGTTKVKVIIFDSSSQTIYDTEYITVKVTGPTVSLSDSNVTITTDEYVDVRVYCPKNGASVRRSVRFTVNDESIATAEWLGWEDEYNTIRIYGVSKGDTTVKISLKDYNTGEVYDTDEISVRVKNPGESTEYGIFEWIIIIVFFGWLWYV